MVRLCTTGTLPRFQHDGLVVVDSWTAVDVAKLDKKARQALLDFYGRFIQIHPADVGELARLGLELADVDGRTRLRPIEKKTAEPEKKNAKP